MKKAFETFFDERILKQDYVYVSAGVRGKQIKIVPQSLIEAIKAKLGDVAV
jgi:ybaK/ebsC protein